MKGGRGCLSGSSELFATVKHEVLTSAPAVCRVDVVLLRWSFIKAGRQGWPGRGARALRAPGG